MAADARLVGQVSGGSTSLTTSLGTTTTSSTFVVAISADDAASITSVSDSKGNTYTLIATAHAGGSEHFKAMYRCENGTGGASHTATVQFSADPTGTVYLIECTGVAAASFDATAQGTPSTSPFTVTTAALSQADEVCVALFGTAGSDPVYASSNFTLIGSETDSNDFWTSCVAKLVVASSAAVTPSFTDSSGSTDTGLIVATFKAAAGGSSTTLTPAHAALALSGRAPNTTAFQNVRIRERLVTASGQGVANAANISLRVWYSDLPSGAPDFSINGLTTDADGTTSWSIPTGSLGFNDRIFFLAVDSVSYSNYTCGHLVPAYE